MTNIPIDRLELIAEAVVVSSASLLGWESLEMNKPTVSDGLSEAKRSLIRFAEGLTDEQAALALRVLKSIVEDGR